MEGVVRRLYAKFGNAIHVNTYVEHPEGEWARDTISLDAWGPRGRNDPIGFELGQRVFDFLYHDPAPPDIDWIIWRRQIRVRSEGYVPRPWGTNPFEYHDDHPHVSYLGKFRILK